jgi:hypothetical protein
MVRLHLFLLSYNISSNQIYIQQSSTCVAYTRATISVRIETRDALTTIKNPLLICATNIWSDYARYATGSAPRCTCRAWQTLSVDHIESIGTHTWDSVPNLIGPALVNDWSACASESVVVSSLRTLNTVVADVIETLIAYTSDSIPSTVSYAVQPGLLAPLSVPVTACFTNDLLIGDAINSVPICIGWATYTYIVLGFEISWLTNATNSVGVSIWSTLNRWDNYTDISTHVVASVTHTTKTIPISGLRTCLNYLAWRSNEDKATGANTRTAAPNHWLWTCLNNHAYTANHIVSGIASTAETIPICVLRAIGWIDWWCNAISIRVCITDITNTSETVPELIGWAAVQYLIDTNSSDHIVTVIANAWCTIPIRISTAIYLWWDNWWSRRSRRSGWRNEIALIVLSYVASVTYALSIYINWICWTLACA